MLKLEQDTSKAGFRGEHPITAGGRALASTPRPGVVGDPRHKERGSSIAAIGCAVVEERREEVKQPGCGRAKCALTPAKEVS